MAYGLRLAGTVIFLAACAAVSAQPPWPTPPNCVPVPPNPGGIPLLFVKISGPAGSRVIMYDGETTRTFASPLVVGLRPMVRYRFGLEGVNPQDDAETLYGSIVVRDVLRLPPRVRASDHPAPLEVSAKDLEQAREGALVSKWIVLEDPKRTASTQLTPGTPAEVEDLPQNDPEETAYLLGRTLAQVHLGGREPDADELRQMCPGQIIFPEQAAGAPSQNDPRVLPIIQPPRGGEEVLKDGGDGDGRIYLDRTGQLSGLNPTATAAEYVNSLGEKQIAISNRVCVVAPRYLLVRHVAPLLASAGVRIPSRTLATEGTVRLDLRRKSLIARQNEETELLKRRDQAKAMVRQERVGKVVDIQRLEAAKLVLGPQSVTGVLVKTEETRDEPLLLQKWVSAEAAKAGDVLTFTIAYKNVGTRPIRDVAVVDSLSSRLEYMAGSAQSDREAVFVTQENDVGSLVLRWEVKDPLPPGKQGVVRFQAKVK